MLLLPFLLRSVLFFISLPGAAISLGKKKVANKSMAPHMVHVVIEMFRIANSKPYLSATIPAIRGAKEHLGCIIVLNFSS